ncbi:unnamed protein product [Durusdinium trenchii]|uniref:Uncharacterized protein n=1 Tax=Durusdinium trenchii TaxID=1381693 RepID=A0ABP0NM05_9DINO
MKHLRIAFLLVFVACGLWCVFVGTVLWTEKAQQPQSDPATLPPAELLHPQPAPAHPPPSPECDRPSAAELISKEALGKKVTVAFVLLGKRRNYFKKFPIEELNLEDRKLYPVEKAYKNAWESAGVTSIMSVEEATFVVSKQQTQHLLNLCTEYPRHQVFNHLPFTQPITLKSSLAFALKRFVSRVPWRVEVLRLMPSSFVLRNKRDCLDFRRQVSSAMWIHKQDRRHNSQGVRLLKPEEAQTFAQTCSTNQTRRPRGMVQQYLANPLLVNGHKCDFRVYLYIPTSVPLVAFYSSAWYMKCGHQQFNLSSTDPENVVTNTKVHGKLRERANYSQLVLGPKQVQDVLGPKLGPAHKDFVQVELDAKIKQKLGLLMEVMESQAEDLQTTGYELLGCDMMLDADLNLWLIEVNNSPELMPSLGARQKAVDHILPAVVKSQPVAKVD